MSRGIAAPRESGRGNTAGLDVLEKRNACYSCQELNPRFSSP